MRNFIRYATQMPIDVSVADEYVDPEAPLINISVGGLCCESDAPVEVGALIDISMAQLNPDFRGTGVVAWCRKKQNGKYELGVEFSENGDGFRIRMVKQICQIEHYKREVRHAEGRHLSSEEAAKEWIIKNAASFDAGE